MGIPLSDPRRNAAAPLDLIALRAQIDTLRASAPELWNEDGDLQLLQDMLDAETELLPFLAALVKRSLEANAYAAGLDLLIHDLATRLERHQGRVARLRALMFKAMQWADIKTVILPAATLTIRAGQQKVVITDEAALPAQYVRTKTEPDKAAIKDSILHGVNVPGAELSNAEPSLSIKVK